MTAPLRVCIDARFPKNVEKSGVVSFVLALADGLHRINEGDEEYYFLVFHSGDWLAKQLRQFGTLLKCNGPERDSSVRSLLRKSRFLRRLKTSFLDRRKNDPVAIPISDGTAENARIDVIHFVKQSAFLTTIPSIYHPHDLQHIHLPQYFSESEIQKRELLYRVFCKAADRVAVTSSFIQKDLCLQFGLPPNKIEVVPLAPPNEFTSPDPESVAAVRAKFGVPDRFIFYPAQTWPHKNHELVVRAISLLRDRGVRVDTLFCGQRTDYYEHHLAPLVKRLQVSDRVQFLGNISDTEVAALYTLCESVVIPTRYEAASFPMWEAFHAGKPVAASAVTSLPEQGGDAVLFFDPSDVIGAARAIEELWVNEGLRVELARRGHQRVSGFSWINTASHFRALYRSIAALPLGEHDTELLSRAPEL